VTTIYQRVRDALGTLNPVVPFALKPYLTANGTPLPDTFIDFQLIDSAPEQHADNAETERSYQVQVSVWDTTGLAALPNVDGVMSAAGFKKSDQRQLTKDPGTGHYGLATDYIYLENQ
jgi:hypothetical protein